MTEITMTAKQIVNLGLWSKVCEYKGWEYLSADRVDDNEVITFDDTFEKPEEESKNKTVIIEGNVYEREFECGSWYSTYGDIQNGNDYLTDELLEFEGMRVRVTIEVIE